MKRIAVSTDDRNSKVKRLKTGILPRKALRLKYRQSGVRALAENPQDPEQMTKELDRSICLALYGSGFDTVKTSALESFRSAVDEYMTHFAHKVQRSMQSCRRTQPLPQDFIFALSQSSLSPSALLAEHDLHIPISITQAPVIPQSPDQIPRLFRNVPFVASEATASNRRRSYVPKHFPIFPSEHSYLDTAVYTARETDSLRIREKAMEEGQQAERALRKLMAANKGIMKNSRTGPRRKVVGANAKAVELFRAALADLEEEPDKGNIVLTHGNGFGMEEAGDGVMTAVNWDRRYWRRM